MHPETVTLTRRLCKKLKRTRRLCKNAYQNYHTNPEILLKNSKEPGDYAKMHPETITLTRRLYKKTQKNPETLQKRIPKLSH